MSNNNCLNFVASFLEFEFILIGMNEKPKIEFKKVPTLNQIYDDFMARFHIFYRILLIE